MEYTVHALGKLAGVSTRTLRYYDEIGILKPARINSSGYRIYGQNEVDKLQQILFYRELDVPLETIKNMMASPTFDVKQALKEHHEKLLAKKEQLHLLIANVEKTMETIEGSGTMSNQEKFVGFKKKMIEDNEAKYGKEIREKYGEEMIDQSNAKLMNMSENDYRSMVEVEKTLFSTLQEALKEGNPAGEAGQKTAGLHKQWLSFTWPEYTKEAHAGLAEMYVADERFTSYYDKVQVGATAFLRDAILIYTGMASKS
ncbi:MULTISPECIES: MerR family transcriptional regulator [unclassified Bacillus (in: firmicutes)]|uniref:MerR family transcriptional regulator n=1 Tax=Bacillaceae TaxID=186817 RepID=UPI0004E1FDDD|nr:MULTISPECIES: MerR family transcriptional regulator [unclassified Bacillus (in: firmicutes)]